MAKRRGPAWAQVTRIMASAVFFVTMGWNSPIFAQDATGDLMGPVVDRSAAVTPAAGVKVVNDGAGHPCFARHAAIGQDATGGVCATAELYPNFSFARLMNNSPRGMPSTLAAGSAGSSNPATLLTQLPPRHETSIEQAYVKGAQSSGKRGTGSGGMVPLVLMCVAVHAAVTFDAWSTNNALHHQFPAGYHPEEADPIMRPFAGGGAMYPMMNLVFAVPFDILLYETHRQHVLKPARMLAYGVATAWVGIELRQSIINLQEEHIGSSH